MIDKRYVPNPHEVEFFRIEGIWKNFELIAVVHACREQHPLQFPMHTK
jgi:hypothetical protein